MIENIKQYGKIVCAALFYNDCIYMSKNGHGAIFTMEPIGVLKSAKQGFVTENGFFVDRKLGLIIASYYDQIETKHDPKNLLFSEDLKKDNVEILNKKEEYVYKLKK